MDFGLLGGDFFGGVEVFWPVNWVLPSMLHLQAAYLTKNLEMLNTTDVCVNPDVVNEMNDKSTMNKIMEYMAKPIVQFDL